MRVPWGIIRQLVYTKQGKRQPKHTPLIEDSEVLTKYFHIPQKLTPLQPTGIVLVKPRQQTMVGNLLNDDYRYFVGHMLAARPNSTCRGCDASIYTPGERDYHLMTCKMLVLSVMTKLRDALPCRCTVCDVCTLRTCWGVPLCCENCETTWRFTLPQAFREARASVAKVLLAGA